ncbi:MAG: hypothetical protein ACLPV4_10575, partial [Solirubrobacteraceae bacterium]
MRMMKGLAWPLGLNRAGSLGAKNGRVLAFLTLMVVAAVSAPAVASAAGPPPMGPAAYTITPELRSMIKYFEGIPTRLPIAKDGYGQRATLKASEAVLYEDSEDNCTVGWGHLVHKKACREADGGPWPFESATNQLNTDIETDVIIPLDKCDGTRDLSSGEVIGAAGLVYNYGTGIIGDRCKGWLQEQLDKVNDPDYDWKDLTAGHHQSPAWRPAVEIWEASGGRAGDSPVQASQKKYPPDYKSGAPTWKIDTAIETTNGAKGADGKITITTQPPDPVAGLTGKPTTYVCARTEKPEDNCGKFYPYEQVDITATPGPGWTFDKWKEMNTKNDAKYRDLCAEEDPKASVCSLPVQDQLVRAIAVFKKAPSCPAPGSASDARAAGGTARHDA